MQLSYYKDSRGNFGDDLNPWVWYSLYPELFQERGRGTILGIGTLINDRTRIPGPVYVCGSGTGYYGAPPPEAGWNYVFVRGPKTADYLGLSPDFAITDPAILVSELVPKRPSQTSMVSYMPHHVSAYQADWAEVCRQVGLTYLDPTADIHQTILQISRSKFVIAEAMHAAIVADALRVPWMPVRAYQHILEFKWQDWCASLKMAYAPEDLPELWDIEPFSNKKELFKSAIKKGLIRLGMDAKSWTPPLPTNNRQQVWQSVLDKLTQLKNAPTLYLSDARVQDDAKRRLMETMDAFSARMDLAGPLPPEVAAPVAPPRATPHAGGQPAAAFLAS
ncbi:polysaccharide pyruvyl transferase family protein [Pseudorhodoferax sp. Leaf267]|uniref:polysaccharide pyruvyl transferase family protein n=1 Tax=Pseudorhodoferax sp. Leaf267 TaxID=1736316 RepID=UPI00138F7B39|nr:polysaccharide pyruvyl transferase family protein [Pseudorhodoferax sp. Leaf267]